MDQNILILFSAVDDEEELVVGWQEKLFSQVGPLPVSL